MGNENTNWQDLIYRNAISSFHDLSVSRGYKNANFRSSIGFTNQDGILKTDNFKRTSFSFNYDQRLLENHLKVTLNTKGSVSENRNANQGAIGAAVAFDPTQSVYENNAYGGYFEWLQNDGTPQRLATRNPLSLLLQNYDRGQTNRSISNIILDYKFHFLPEMRVNFNTGYDYSVQRGDVYIPKTAASNYINENAYGFTSTYENINKSRFMDAYLNYVKELESIDSRIDVTAGYSYQHFYRHGRFENSNLQGENRNTDNGLSSENWLESYFGRLFITHKGKYSITATLRNDRSSRFSEKNRNGYFPSAAIAWNISEETFLNEYKTVNNLKLRIGWGVSGQQEIGDFGYLSVYTLGNDRARYQIGNNFIYTYRPEGYDSNVKWEETTTYNAGIDYGLWNNRVSGSIDAYIKKTKDLLNFIPLPAGSNLENALTTNIGEMDSRGLEISINTIPVMNDNFRWDFNLNGTFQHREITKLTLNDDPSFPGTPTGGISGGVGNNIQIHSTGYNPSAFYVFQQVYDTNGRPLEGVYNDTNGDGNINDADKYRYKNPDPDFYFGISSNLTYKNFDWSFTFRGSLGNYMYNNVSSSNGYKNSMFIGAGNYITNASTSLLQTNFVNAQFFSDYYIENASFLKLDNMTFGYNFDLNKTQMRLFITGQNLFTLTNYSGLDPEIPNGIDNNIYPKPRNFLAGLNVTF